MNITIPILGIRGLPVFKQNMIDRDNLYLISVIDATSGCNQKYQISCIYCMLRQKIPIVLWMEKEGSIPYLIRG
jgi:hypothetical protein